MRRNVWLGAALCLTLAGCGDDGGSSSAASGVRTVPIAASPSPSPAPAPAPTPAPVSVPWTGGTLNSRVGLTQLAEFPTLSWLFRPLVPGDANGVDLIRFEHDAARSLSIVTVPGYSRGALIEFATETTEDLSFSFIDPALGAWTFFDRGIAVALLVPGLQNRVFALAFTSVGWIGWQGIGTAAADRLSGALVYGVPMAAGDRLVDGVGRYALYGFEVRRAAGATGRADMGSTGGELRVDPSTSRFDGFFLTGARADRFEFASATIAADGSFSGTLRAPGFEGQTRFEGRFTGLQGRELMLRWQGPYRDPATGVTGTTFGALAGRRD